MTRDDIIRMAHEAGLHLATEVHWMPIIDLSYAERFAALVAAAERKRIISANAPEIERINEYIKTLEEAVAWVGLTDEERNNLWRDVIGWGDPSHDDEDLMKAIEAKLKEKNT